MSDTEPRTADETRIEDDTLCLQCGYALRGLKLADACPECGLSVKLTRDRLHGLSSRQFFTLGLRLFAVIVLAWPFIHDYGIINNLIWMLLEDQGWNTYYGTESVTSLLIPGISAIVIATVLWFAAPLIACIAAPVSYPLIANIGGPRTAMMILLCLFALWMVATGTSDLMYSLGQYVTADIDSDQTTAGAIPGWVSSGLFRIIAGIFLLG